MKPMCNCNQGRMPCQCKKLGEMPQARLYETALAGIYAVGTGPAAPDVRYVDAGPFPRSKADRLIAEQRRQLDKAHRHAEAFGEGVDALLAKAPKQATYWRDTAMALSDDLVQARQEGQREAKARTRYMMLAGVGWVLLVAALVNGWAA